MEKRRRILAAVLLAVFLPAFLASVLHDHPAAAAEVAECMECVHHHPHAGHISAYHGGISDCVLCHFLGLPFVVSLAAVILLSAALRRTFYLFSYRPHLAVFLNHLRSRAPPVFSAA